MVCNECRGCDKLDEDTEGWVRVIFDTPRHFLSPDIELIAGLHIGRQIAQHKEAAEARAMAAAQAEQDCLADLAKAAEPALMDVIHTFVVSTHNDKHDARVRTVYETVHVPEEPQVDYWRQYGMYPSAPRPTKTTTEVTRSGYYLPVILVDSQMLPGRTVVFSDGNDAFRRYRARSAQYQHNSRYEHLAVLNKHKLTDDDCKTAVLTRFEGKYNAGAQHEVLWLASSAALADWSFQDVHHVIHYDLPSDAVA